MNKDESLRSCITLAIIAEEMLLYHPIQKGLKRNLKKEVKQVNNLPGLRG